MKNNLKLNGSLPLRLLTLTFSFVLFTFGSGFLKQRFFHTESCTRFQLTGTRILVPVLVPAGISSSASTLDQDFVLVYFNQEV